MLNVPVSFRVLAAVLTVTLMACAEESPSGVGFGDVDSTPDAGADAASEDGSAGIDDTGSVEDAAADASTALPPLPEAWSPEETDFDCLTRGRAVRGFWLTNPLGPEYEDEAVRIAEAGMMEALPPGTMIQLVPQEAMVKLLPGSDPETGDWEYFNLEVSSTGTRIVERGGAEVSNGAGSCLGCHAGAIERDYVCEQTGLCAAAAIPRNIIDALVAGDERCN